MYENALVDGDMANRVIAAPVKRAAQHGNEVPSSAISAILGLSLIARLRDAFPQERTGL